MAVGYTPPPPSLESIHSLSRVIDVFGVVLQEEQEDFKGKERGEEESVSISAKSTRRNPLFSSYYAFI